MALAAALNCETRPDGPADACGECDPCRKIASSIHPDVQTLETQGAAQSIPIKTIREQVIPQLALPPHEGRARVFLVEEALSLRGPAANALLKTLEEPPERTHFILCTTAPDQLLPTIRSRCQRISFASLPPDMRADLDAGEESDGCADTLREYVEALVDSASRTDFGSLSNAAARSAKSRDDVRPTLRLLTHRLHELALNATRDGRVHDATRLARQATIVLDTEAAIATNNAHGLIAMEAMIRRMRTAAPHDFDHVRRARPRR